MARATVKYTTEDSFCVSFTDELRGYHAYMDKWKPSIGQEVYGAIEWNNSHDKYSIAFTTTHHGQNSIDFNSRETVDVCGHIPKEMSRVVHYFIQKYGGEVKATVVAPKFTRSNRAEGKTD